MLILKLIIAAFFALGNPGTSEVKSIEPIIEALDRGSSSDLAQFFDSSIQLNLNGQQGSYSRNQAEQVLKEFFRRNPPTSFAVVYVRGGNSTLSSYVGDYQSPGRDFKVFLKVSEKNEILRLYSLEFVEG